MIASAPFRLEHYRQLLSRLLALGSVEFITYADLMWQPGDDHRVDYPLEWAAWRAAICTGALNPHSIYVLIQHDIDSGPQQTLDMLNLESEYGIISTTMVFSQWRGPALNEELMVYPADFASMSKLEQQGFVFGYHCNAFHNNCLSEEGLYDLFMEDVASLRRRLSIQFFSPHGGLTVNGIGNASFDYIGETNADVKHVHNGHSPRFNSTYSDGGLMKRLFECPSSLDFLAWCDKLKPGGRYRLLIHPQYFSDELFVPLRLEIDSWYSELTTR